MQKRTNPLELKLELKQEPVFPEVTEPEVVEPDLEETVEIVAPEMTERETDAEVKEEVSEALVAEERQEAEAEEESVAPVKEAPQAKPEKKATKKKAANKKAMTEEKPVRRPIVKKPAVPSVIESEDTHRTPVMSGDMRWQRVVTPTAPAVKAEQEPMPTRESDVSAAVNGTFFRPIVEEPAADVYEDEMQQPVVEDLVEETASDEVYEQEEKAAATDGYIDDETAELSLEDYEMSVRFGLCGRVSRGMKMTKVSRDVCRLAQLMHPNQSLSTIIENALLTRIYLENRDAFDAMAEMIEKKGGHIKC